MKAITLMKATTLLLTCLLSFGCVYSEGHSGEKHSLKDDNKKKEKKVKLAGKAKAIKNGKELKKGSAPSPQITVVKRWDLPAELVEVSAIAWMDKDRFACVQDEAGSIYVFNHASNKIERKIDFSGPGDFEGLTLVGNAAYAVRSDGMLYEVSDIYAARPTVKQYNTPLTATQNIEGLCYDKKNNRLLLAVKDQEPGNVAYKGIYQFDLASRKLVAQPAYKVALDNELSVVQKGKKERIIRPSEIGKYPGTDRFYILDGPNAGLLLMDSKGQLTARYSLGRSFAKPEGITFSPQGNIYISNEGKKEPANITEIRLAQ
jgi:uncharacterized protein YjiK